VKLLLLFVLGVVVLSVWETGRERPQKALPLLLGCTFVAGALFSFSRLI
jgi:hypothetical protein